MKKGAVFTALLRVAGIIVLMLGVRMVGRGVYNYIDEHNRNDWISATAYVIDISSGYSGSRHHRRIHYDITCQYEADGNRYSVKLYNRSQAMRPGDKVKIKYDPGAPENATDILAPSIHNLIIFLVFGVSFITIGFFLSGIWALLCKIRRGGGAKEEEILPPEEYAEAEETNGNNRSRAPATVFRIVAIAAALGGMFLPVRLFPGIRPIEVQEGKSPGAQSGSLHNSEQEQFSFEGTVFRYGTYDYDVSARNQSINSILSVTPVGQKIVIECHAGPKNGVYCIFDTESESFDEDIMGNNLVWHSDDITTSVYSFWSEVHTYDGSVIKTYDLAEDAFIYDLKFSNDCTKLDVTIMHDDGAETDTLTLPGRQTTPQAAE